MFQIDSHADQDSLFLDSGIFEKIHRVDRPCYLLSLNSDLLWMWLASPVA